MYSTAGVSAVSGTTSCCSQTFSNSVFGWLMGSLELAGLRQLTAATRGADMSTGVEPAPLVRRLAGEQAEERRLQRFGDRPALAVADRQAIHRADRRDLRRRAGQEDLVREVQQLARNRLSRALRARARAPGA